MTSTDLSGLSASTTYYFKINSVEYSIVTGSTEPTYAEVADLMDAEINSAGFRAIVVGTAPNEDIRVLNDAVRGSGSETILDLGTTGTDLFTSLTGFVDFDEPVPGEALGSLDLDIVVVTEAISITGTSPFTITVGPEVGGITVLSSNITADEIDVTFDLTDGTAILSGLADTAQIDYAYPASGSAVFNETDDVAEHTVEFTIETSGSAVFNETDDVAEYTVEFTIETSGSAIFAGEAITEQEYEPVIYGTDSYYGDVVYES